MPFRPGAASPSRDAVGRVEGYTAQQLMLKPSEQRGFTDQSAALRPARESGTEPLDQVQTQPSEHLQMKPAAPQVQLKAGKAERDLDYNTTGSGTNKRDPEQTDGTLPFEDDGTWDANDILIGLTQVDDDSDTLNDNNRCAASSVLAFHVQAGPPAVSAVATDVATQMQGQIDTRPAGMSDAVFTSFQTLQPVIAGIPGRITAKDATYQDLRRLANCMKLVVDPNPGDGTQVSEYPTLAALGGKSAELCWADLTGQSQLETMASQLVEQNRRNYGWILAVSTRATENGSTNHAVTFARNGQGAGLLLRSVAACWQPDHVLGC